MKAGLAEGSTSMAQRIMQAFAVCCTFSVLMYMFLAIYNDDSVKLMPSYKLFKSPRLPQGEGWYQGQTLMEELGFVRNPRLFPQSYHDDESIPVVLSAASSLQFLDLMDFVKSLRIYFHEKRLVIYNLGLSDEEKAQVLSVCRCQIRTVRWERFPAHVRNLKFGAFRPILIQEALVEFGAVFWCDPLTRFYSAEMFPLVQQAKRVGVVAWPIFYPTSAVTHPSLFEYFNVSSNDYLFHRFVESEQFIAYNLLDVHKHLMLPWVKCALDVNCIAPSGVRSRQCHRNLKPLYLYTGCHKYDASAFNILLGKMFNFELPYVSLLDLFNIARPHKKPVWRSSWNYTILNWFSK